MQARGRQHHAEDDEAGQADDEDAGHQHRHAVEHAGGPGHAGVAGDGRAQDQQHDDGGEQQRAFQEARPFVAAVHEHEQQQRAHHQCLQVVGMPGGQQLLAEGGKGIRHGGLVRGCPGILDSAGVCCPVMRVPGCHR